MDSGGILCLHYSFGCGLALLPCFLHTPDVHPLLSADRGGEEPETLSPLGTAGEDIPQSSQGSHGQRGC